MGEMDSQVLYHVSLVAAFIAGMVALFAPCCISYLLPAYLGNVFKEKKKVLLMTLVYSAGIFLVMLPVVLGAKALANLFFQLHDTTYIVGGAVMIIVAALSFFGIKLPMPHMRQKQQQGKPDILSTFTLGIFAGITSACCAPVLVGVMAFSSLSPNIVSALGIGASYVLGMVAPLYIAALLLEKGNILEREVFRKRLFFVNIGGNHRPIFVSNVVASAIFLVTGVLTIVLSLMGKLAMPAGGSQITRTLNAVAMRVTELTDTIPGINVLFAVIAVYLVYKVIRSLRRN